MAYDVTCPYVTGKTVTANLLIGGTVTASGLSCSPLASDSSLYGVSLAGQAAGNYVVAFYSGGGRVGSASIVWSGSVEVTAATPSQIAAVILKTPQNLLATNSDGSVTLSGGAGVSITVVSPLSINGLTMQLVQGDSYTVANGRSLSFSITGQTGLIGSIAHLRITGLLADLAVSPVITSGTQTVVFNDVLATTTSLIPAGQSIPYQIHFINGVDVATPLQGMAQVLKAV